MKNIAIYLTAVMLVVITVNINPNYSYLRDILSIEIITLGKTKACFSVKGILSVKEVQPWNNVSSKAILKKKVQYEGHAVITMCLI